MKYMAKVFSLLRLNFKDKLSKVTFPLASKGFFKFKDHSYLLDYFDYQLVYDYCLRSNFIKKYTWYKFFLIKETLLLYDVPEVDLDPDLSDNLDFKIASVDNFDEFDDDHYFGIADPNAVDFDF